MDNPDIDTIDTQDTGRRQTKQQHRNLKRRTPSKTEGEPRCSLTLTIIVNLIDKTKQISRRSKDRTVHDRSILVYKCHHLCYYFWQTHLHIPFGDIISRCLRAFVWLSYYVISIFEHNLNITPSVSSISFPSK
jgi:hypothetical protein